MGSTRTIAPDMQIPATARPPPRRPASFFWTLISATTPRIKAGKAVIPRVKGPRIARTKEAMANPLTFVVVAGGGGCGEIGGGIELLIEMFLS
jgi:hypothetical protein